MNEEKNIDFDKEFAPWQSGSAFNMYWQYSYLTRAAFYANVKPEYREYMTRWVQNALYWYDGWVPYFHSSTEGIFSTRIGTALVSGAAKKVIGGRIFYKNANREENNKGSINEAVHFISSEWSVQSRFAREIKRVTEFAAAAGTALLKLNKDSKGLWAEALRFDSFYPTVGARGKLLEVYCFLRNFVQLRETGASKQNVTSFYVVEHRYFGDYRHLDGRITKNAPLCEYIIQRSAGTVVSGQDYSLSGERIKLESLPKSVRSDIGKAYIGIEYDKPILLPFSDHLGAVLVNWTESVSNIPELPFGDSLLSNIMPYLQAYDYYFSAFCTDMYIGRGQVLMPAYMTRDARKKDGYYSGKEGCLFRRMPPAPNEEENKPLPIQFELRSSEWKEIRDTLMQNIAINTRMNISTIASFLQDSNSQKTAREISTEESETALFVDDKREIIEKPINELLKIVLRYYGYQDDVVIRWSQAGLSNVYTRTEMIATAVSGGFCSKYKAVQMFDQDDDEYQIAEEYARCVDDEKQANFGGMEFNESDYYGGENAQDNPPQTNQDSEAVNSVNGNENGENGEKTIQFVR